LFTIKSYYNTSQHLHYPQGNHTFFAVITPGNEFSIHTTNKDNYLFINVLQLFCSLCCKKNSPPLQVCNEALQVRKSIFQLLNKVSEILKVTSPRSLSAIEVVKAFFQLVKEVLQLIKLLSELIEPPAETVKLKCERLKGEYEIMLLNYKVPERQCRIMNAASREFNLINQLTIKNYVL
jgi:predicted O-linked N-acetylglucosamine transferase (SPINDLY family)